VAPLNVGKDDELVVIPVPGLDGVPWAAVHAGPVAVAPSATIWARTAAALRADNPMFSSLLLSDGPMTLQEIYARGLAPRRLILASCQSGSQASYAGDEVLCFVAALLARGTAGILASAAVVPDVPAAVLMTAVHRRLSRGTTLARALHEAREAQDTEDPAAS
ncbi:MAG TPA: CHAT domain-containing protein, partial [Streptosporangiaceae bacterium]